MLKYFTVGHLRRGLERVSRPRRAAILFGLDSGIDLETVISLKWSDIKKPQLRWKMKAYSRHIANAQPRHITSPYVFWEFHKNMPMPLFGLQQEIVECFDMALPELRAAYKDMLWIDEEVESAYWHDNALQVFG